MSKIKFKKIKYILPLMIIFFYIKNSKTENISFVDGISDLPLFKSMENVNENLVIFDTNEGRIVRTEIVGRVNLSEANDFYSTILPNLGWTKTNENQYIRENEVLSVVFLQEKNNILIKFNIAPN
tara:strand:+ start:1105 stop:1479 length:375 start_codon:yes stop_codon:yes gene_type:complete